MGGLILGVNTLLRLLCFFKLFPMVGKGLFQLPNNRSLDQNTVIATGTNSRKRITVFYAHNSNHSATFRSRGTFFRHTLYKTVK